MYSSIVTHVNLSLPPKTPHSSFGLPGLVTHTCIHAHIMYPCVSVCAYLKVNAYSRAGHAYMYTFTYYLSMCVCMRTFTQVNACMYTHKCTHIHAHTQMHSSFGMPGLVTHTCIHVHIRYPCMYIFTYHVSICVCMRTFAQVNAYMYTHMHVRGIECSHEPQQ
jgi:hypothetical protein